MSAIRRGSPLKDGYLVVGHVGVGLPYGLLDQRLLETELGALVDDIDAGLVERQYSHIRS